MAMQFDLFGGEPTEVRPRRAIRVAEPMKTIVRAPAVPRPRRTDPKPIAANLPDGWSLMDHGDEVKLVPPDGFVVDGANSPGRLWYSAHRARELAVADAERICRRIIAGTWSPTIEVQPNYHIARGMVEDWLEKWRGNGWKRLPAGANDYTVHLTNIAVLAQLPDELCPPEVVVQRMIERQFARVEAAAD